MAHRRIKRRDLVRMLWRCFFIQGSWNFKTMLGIGFCFCCIPIVRRLYDNEAEREEFLKRHLVFFNAHPYLATICLGACAKLEEQARNQEAGWTDMRPIEIFKERLIGPLGAIGDEFFWKRVKPLAAALGVLFAVTIGWLAVPIFLIVYNAPHLRARFEGLLFGYRKGFDIVRYLSMRRLQKYQELLSVVGSLVTGILMVALFKWHAGHDFADVIPFSMAIVITFLLLMQNRSINLIIILVSLFMVVLYAIVPI